MAKLQTLQSLLFCGLIWSPSLHAEPCRVVAREGSNVWAACPRTMSKQTMAYNVSLFAKAAVAANREAHVYIFDQTKYTPKSHREFGRWSSAQAARHQLMVFHTIPKAKIKIMSCMGGARSVEPCGYLLSNSDGYRRMLLDSKS